ncbi:Malonyl CoA-acyl carrier protein transacylase [Candidatus Izimaplasma bacterium HR1]|jgi:[acyl-carrier-protein] S-malonyltransferase|uniref:ACP S-malonyltransferase n=1 Tax=Candidatus Izimoplasma sp. HR1 TaxID=1541959 RepID=UPI0004F9346A|nr:Malonyl CoA-acyl carrier protein transacylase [Candidatus Izimaplasma bacterium HR1]
MKKAFMFSGQGSQYLGMCKELYDEYPTVRSMFEKATLVLGYNVKDIMFNDEAKLNNTLYTQPLMFVMYASILQVLKEKGITSDYTLGLSLGEYGAYYDSECFTFEEGLKLVQKRAIYMTEACFRTKGKMSAILGMEAELLLEIIEATDGYVKIANYNTYGQLVISGVEKAVLRVNELALENGAKRAILLNTSGPFHTDLMFYAKEKFNVYLKEVKLAEPTKPLLLNTTGNFYENSLKENMVKQITNSVMFYQEIEKLLKDDVTTFIEIGPKRTLSSFVKKISRKVTILNVEDISSLNKTILALEE